MAVVGYQGNTLLVMFCFVFCFDLTEMLTSAFEITVALKNLLFGIFCLADGKPPIQIFLIAEVGMTAVREELTLALRSEPVFKTFTHSYFRDVMVNKL